MPLSSLLIVPTKPIFDLLHEDQFSEGLKSLPLVRRSSSWLGEEGVPRKTAAAQQSPSALSSTGLPGELSHPDPLSTRHPDGRLSLGPAHLHAQTRPFPAPSRAGSLQRTGSHRTSQCLRTHSTATATSLCSQGALLRLQGLLATVPLWPQQQCLCRLQRLSSLLSRISLIHPSLRPGGLARASSFPGPFWVFCMDSLGSENNGAALCFLHHSNLCSSLPAQLPLAKGSERSLRVKT